MCFGRKKKEVPAESKIQTWGSNASRRAVRAIKLVLCGNAAVGKTTITMRFKEGVFKKSHEPTLAGAYQEKRVRTRSNEEIQLNIWDTAGDERFRAIMPLYYRDAEIALLVFDITEPESFQAVDYWLEQLEEKVRSENMLLCRTGHAGIVGNKRDLEDERRVSKDEATLKASERRNCLYFETSAKTGDGVDEMFEALVEEYLKMKPPAASR